MITGNSIHTSFRKSGTPKKVTTPNNNSHLHTEFVAYNLSDDDPALARVKSALKSLGMTPTMQPSGGGTDGNVFRLNDISAVVVGMADHGMHTVREYVTIPDLVDAAHLCETLLRTDD